MSYNSITLNIVFSENPSINKEVVILLKLLIILNSPRNTVLKIQVMLNKVLYSGGARPK